MPPTISVVRGSVLDQDVDAIVNAANTSMRGGGGVDGAIHRSAGPEMAMHLMKVAPRGAKTGTVVVTPGFRLKQRYVFHTPGPFWSSGDLNERELLSSCYRNCLLEAESMPDVRSIAFCSISTGIYRFPLDLAAELAIGIAREHAVDSGLERIVFAMFGEPEFRAFSSAHGTV